MISPKAHSGIHSVEVFDNEESKVGQALLVPINLTKLSVEIMTRENVVGGSPNDFVSFFNFKRLACVNGVKKRF